MKVKTLILKTQEIGSMNIEVERKLVCAVRNQKQCSHFPDLCVRQDF